MTERGLQQSIFDFLRIALPTDAVCFSVPNGDGRMTTMPGALPGVPDVCVVYKGRAIFIELKTKTGAVRLSQRHIHDRLTMAGAVVTVCRSVEDVATFLSMLMPLRARVSA